MIHGPSIIRLVSAYLSRHPSKRYTKSCAATRAPRESPINHHHQPPSKIPIEPRTSSKPNSSSRARKKKKKKKRSSGFEDRDCSRIRLYIHIYAHTKGPLSGAERGSRGGGERSSEGVAASRGLRTRYTVGSNVALLATSPGSRVPFCINRETPRPCETSGSWRNSSNPAQRSAKG